MNAKERNELIDDLLSGCLSEADLLRLEAELVIDAAARRAYLERVALSQALTEEAKTFDLHASHAAERGASDPSETLPVQQDNRRLSAMTWLLKRPLQAAAAIALIAGAGSATAVWALQTRSPEIASSNVRELGDGSFEETPGAISAGFPQVAGVWSGDAAERLALQVPSPKEGRGMLRFVKAEPDAGNPTSQAMTCDVFQVVDLRQLRRTQDVATDATLELSAWFNDARNSHGVPVTFFCKIMLFEGSLESIRTTWPQALSEALGSGLAQFASNGDDPPQWRNLTARCVASTKADFALIQLSARPDLRVPVPPSLYVDQVQLTLKTQPQLPVRTVAR